MGSLRSKLNRAICAYLIDEGIGGPDNIFPTNSTKKRTYPNVTVISKLALEDPAFSGNERITVSIEVTGSATQSPDDTNPEDSRVAYDNLVESVWNALRQTDNGTDLRATALDITTIGRALAVDASNGSDPLQVQLAENNADMAAFTINGWFPKGSGDGDLTDEEGASWKDILIFEAMCCPANVD